MKSQRSDDFYKTHLLSSSLIDETKRKKSHCELPPMNNRLEKQPSWGPISTPMAPSNVGLDRQSSWGMSSLVGQIPPPNVSMERQSFWSDVYNTFNSSPYSHIAMDRQYPLVPILGLTTTGFGRQLPTDYLPNMSESLNRQPSFEKRNDHFLYPDYVNPMSFQEKQELVKKITLLPSQYLRGLLDVISKYQMVTVQQTNEEYDFDLGQMHPNTLWAIHDYIQECLNNMKGYQSNFQWKASAAHSEASTNSPKSEGIDDRSTSQDTTDGTGPDDDDRRDKFIAQVHMYTTPKVSRSKSKPSKKHECTMCQKQFRGKSELLNHIRTHTGEKPLVCSNPGCGKRYAHSSNLRAHERTHQGIKPYICHYDGCGKSFAHSVSLKEHIWMHAGVQPYECPYKNCRRKFTQVSNFARHKKLHMRKDKTIRETMEIENNS